MSSNPTSQLKIVTAEPRTDVLNQVIGLGDSNSQFLGHFPRSCYEREATKGRIIAAVTGEGRVAGYLLFWTAKQRAKIQHCCVDERFRGQGVGKRLVDEVKRRAAQLLGIELHCAREFTESCRFWEANGFTPIDEKLGRGAVPRPLTRFVFDHRKADLFTEQLDLSGGDRLLVVVDTNIAFDWQDPDRETAPESLALRADWLASEIDLRICDHAFTDADMHPEESGRKRRKQFLRSLPKVNEDRAAADGIREQLEGLFSPMPSRSLKVDVLHLAAAAAADADVFVTHDREILDAAKRIEGAFGLTVCEPAVLITRLDENLRAHRYHPVRLSGSPVTLRRLAAADLSNSAASFLDYGGGERKSLLEARTRDLLADPQSCQVSLIEWPVGAPIGLLGVDESDAEAHVVSVFRFRESAVTPVLIRHSVSMLVRRAVERRCTAVIVDDQALTEEVGPALEAAGFRFDGTRWLRFIVKGVRTRASMVDHFRTRATEGRWASASDMVALVASGTAATLERVLWPVKVSGEGLRSFIVPIGPGWAIDLFDEGLAQQRLRGGEPALLFNTENVYYRAARPEIVKAPGRILWYVSDDGGHECPGEIRACAPLMEVEIGPAKQLYARNRKLGAYEWRHVLEKAHGDPHGPVMALRFGVSESFKEPLSRETIKDVLSEYGRPMPPLSTAYELPEECFARLYRLGQPD